MTYEQYSKELTQRASQECKIAIESTRRKLPVIPASFASDYETMDSFSITSAVHKMLELAIEHTQDPDFDEYRFGPNEPYYPWTLAHCAFDPNEPECQFTALTTTHFSRANLHELSQKLQRHEDTGLIYKVSACMYHIGGPSPVTRDGKSYMKHHMVMVFFDMGGNYASFLVDADLPLEGMRFELNSCVPHNTDAVPLVQQVWAQIFKYQLTREGQWFDIPADCRD